MTSNVELIIYLEPNKTWRLKVEAFLNRIKEKYGETTENKYGCHISMTGFFNVDIEKLEELENTLENVFNGSNFRSKCQVPQINLTSLIVNDSVTQIPKHLMLPVITPDVYRIAMENVSQACNHIVHLRLKKINHISLAYWDEPIATPTQQQEWQEKVSNGFFDKVKQEADIYFKEVESSASWDIVLYKRVYKGNLVGQHHAFEELSRWTSPSTEI